MDDEDVKIRFKCIEHERMYDAPFIGALISAIDCNINCEKCFNQHLKKRDTKVSTAKGIIDEIIKNKFNEGIILAGLEWSLQINEAVSLCRVARDNNLKTIIYTGNSYDWCIKNAQIYFSVSDYMKFGKYIDKGKEKTSNGIFLSSENQEIIRTS